MKTTKSKKTGRNARCEIKRLLLLLTAAAVGVPFSAPVSGAETAKHEAKKYADRLKARNEAIARAQSEKEALLAEQDESESDVLQDERQDERQNEQQENELEELSVEQPENELAESPDEQAEQPENELTEELQSPSNEEASEFLTELTELDETIPEEELSENQAQETSPDETSVPEDGADSEDASDSEDPEGKKHEKEGDDEDPIAFTFSYLSGAQLLCPGYIVPPHHALPQPERSLRLLRQSLESMLSAYDGTWSIAVKDLTTLEELVINNCEMPSASTLKLFILGCVYEDIANGTLERTEELVARMNDMIRVSSNDAANRLIAQLGKDDYQAGIDRINRYIEEHGYSEYTRAYNPFQDQSLKLDPDHTNTTCVSDCCLLLERIYRRQFGSRKVCNETEDMLLGQETRYKIPRGIGENSLVGNKTGETDEIENDIALVYTPAGDYIVCIFSTGWRDKKEAQAHFPELSAKIYSYFMDPNAFTVSLPELTSLNEWSASLFPDGPGDGSPVQVD